MVLKYRYIGKGITDNNGIAHITEDAEGQTVTGYTGTGKGLTQIVASTDDKDHISSSSLQSEIYELLDNIFYDSGIQGSANPNYTVSGNNISWEAKAENTVINCSTTYGHLFIKNNQQNFPYPLKVEFDIDSFDGTRQYFNVYDVDGEARLWINENGHYIIVISDEGVISATCNGNNCTINPQNSISTNSRLSFFLSGTDVNLKFRNLKIYPI